MHDEQTELKGDDRESEHQPATRWGLAKALDPSHPAAMGIVNQIALGGKAILGVRAGRGQPLFPTLTSPSPPASVRRPKRPCTPLRLP